MTVSAPAAIRPSLSLSQRYPVARQIGDGMPVALGEAVCRAVAVAVRASGMKMAA